MKRAGKSSSQGAEEPHGAFAPSLSWGDWKNAILAWQGRAILFKSPELGHLKNLILLWYFSKWAPWLLGGSRNLSGGSRSHNSFQVILRCYLPLLLCWHLPCWCKVVVSTLHKSNQGHQCAVIVFITRRHAPADKTQTNLVSPKTVCDKAVKMINFIILQLLIRYRFDILTKIWKVHIKQSWKNTGKPWFSMFQWYCFFYRWKVWGDPAWSKSISRIFPTGLDDG